MVATRGFLDSGRRSTVQTSSLVKTKTKGTTTVKTKTTMPVHLLSSRSSQTSPSPPARDEDGARRGRRWRPCPCSLAFSMAVELEGSPRWSHAKFVLRKAFPKRSFDFCNRVVSTIHAVLGVTLASLSVQDWSCPVCPVASTSSPKQMQALAVTLSYLIYDLICCLLDKRVNLDNTIHHLVGIVGIGAGFAYQKCGSEMVAALWITEISSPFLHLREVLKELGYRDTDLNLAADISFAVIFSLARMVGGPYLAYVTLSANNPFVIKAMALGLQLVSAFWFYKIARMVRYKLIKRNATQNLD